MIDDTLRLGGGKARSGEGSAGLEAGYLAGHSRCDKDHRRHPGDDQRYRHHEQQGADGVHITSFSLLRP